ncbi:cardiolipin synthase [uncultured Clostridium sp.]|uniref:cardiolipin synthase n=1 Tax=uncultured Clostridium sp. TaxID=59620 RepID=UPI002637F3CA|nr:cardiolipin synthase [uncultured Clostridium sp.]
MEWSQIVFWVEIILFLLNILFAGIVIFVERKNPTVTLTWILVFVVLPYIGFIIYLLVGQNFSGRKLFKEKAKIDEYKLKILKEKKSTGLQEELLNNKYLDLIKMNYNNCDSLYVTKNEVEIFVTGKDKFDALLKDLKNAKKYIHIDYYIFRKDEIGTEIIEVLEEKLKEGIEVKLLVDDFGSTDLTKKGRLDNYLKLGGEFASFFPRILSYINPRVNYRNHRKMVVIDGEYGYIGGYNVGDEYLGRDPKIGNWRDTHIKIRGEAVGLINERFILDWCYAAKKEINNFEKFKYDGDLREGDVSMQIVTSGPDHTEEYIKNAYVKMITSAKKSIRMTTPYFIPDDVMLESLKIAALSGIDVQIIIPGNPDRKFLQWVANSYVETLIEAGVKVYHYNNGFVHAKVLAIDSEVVSIGSANMDIRSFRLDFEIVSIMYNSEMAKSAEKQFEDDLEYSTELIKEEFRKRGRRIKILESITRLLSPVL